MANESSDKPLTPSAPQSQRAVAQGAQQLVFDLFSSAIAENKAVDEIEKDLGFHKAQIMIDMTGLSRSVRQFINAALFLCEPEIEEQDKDLKMFQWLMNYPSTNIAHFKKVASEAQKSSVKVQIYDMNNPEKDTWISVPLIGTMAIGGGRIFYKVPIEIRGQLQDPEKRSYLSMRIAASFTTRYSLELYEKLLPFQTTGYSPWMTIDEFSKWVLINDLKASKEFRYIRRDVIQPAITQINQESNIYVTLETKSVPGSKRIGQIRFKVEKNMEGRLSPYNTNRITNVEIQKILTEEFALSDSEIQEITSNRETYTDERILSAAEFTRHRIKTSKRPITYHGAYLMKALRENYRIPRTEGLHRAEDADLIKQEAQKKVAAQLARSASDSAQEQATVQSEIMAFYFSLPQEEQARIWGAFTGTIAGKTPLKRAGLAADDPAAIENEMVQKALASYISSKKTMYRRMSQPTPPEA